MFSKMFGKKKTEVSRSKTRHQRVDSGVDNNAIAGQVVNADAERQLFKYEMPSQQRGLTDLIQSHKNGSRFQYVALTGADVEEHGSRIRRLLMTRAIYNKSQIPTKDLPRLRLKEDSERFSLGDAIPAKGKEFILLNKATIVFTPLTSFADKYTTMKISLMDMRLETDQERSSVKANTNVTVKCEFSMDHCVPRTDVNEVFLMISREVSHLSTGRMWGVVQVQLEVLETDFPFMENMKEVVGVLGLPSSGLDTFDKDPMHLDITMHNNHRMKMQDLYASGDIVDETAPMKEKTGRIAYAKSSVAPKSALKKPAETQYDDFISQSIGSEWDYVKTAPKPRIAEDEISEEPEEDGRSIRSPSPPVRNNHATPPRGDDMMSDTVFGDPEEDEEEVRMYGLSTMKPNKGKKEKVAFKVADVN